MNPSNGNKNAWNDKAKSVICHNRVRINIKLQSVILHCIQYTQHKIFLRQSCALLWTFSPTRRMKNTINKTDLVVMRSGFGLNRNYLTWSRILRLICSTDNPHFKTCFLFFLSLCPDTGSCINHGENRAVHLNWRQAGFEGVEDAVLHSSEKLNMHL